jgi:DNA-binding PadR family transcriptional regulator
MTQVSSAVVADRQLTDFEHILLGMIAAAPSSGYDLKRTFAATPMGVYQPSSGSLYPALKRLERRNLLQTRTQPHSARESGRARHVYETTQQGRTLHLAWVRTPVNPATVAADLGLHLMRFVMMEPLLPRTEVLDFLRSLKDALTTFVAELERYTKTTHIEDYHSRLALDHGIAIHRASLAWTERTIATLTDSPTAPAGPPPWAHPLRDGLSDGQQGDRRGRRDRTR